MAKEKKYLSDKRIAFIRQHDCHGVVKAFAASVTDESYDIKKLPLHSITGILYSFYLALKIPRYDVYFTDSAMSNFVPIFKRWFGQKNIIIYRGGDGIFGEKSDAYLYTKNPIKKKILLYILKNIDGVITESEMSKKDAQKWVKCPVTLGISYVNDIPTLQKIRPDLQTKKFLFIGDYRPPYDHKGIEILIETFKLLPKEYEIYIIGKNTETLKDGLKAGNISNIHIEGRVKDLNEYFRKCTYYIHAAKYETGPITVLEAMCAGLIPIISDNCGHKTVVEKVSKDLVLRDLDPKRMAQDIIKISGLNAKKRQNYSKVAKKLINYKYSKETQTEIFRNNFYGLVEEIERKRAKER